MRKIIYVLIAFVCLSALALADTVPSPVPSPLPVPGLGAWVSGQGGWMAAILALVISFNVVCTALHQVCQKLKLSEPIWLKNAGALGEKILGYLTANTQSK